MGHEVLIMEIITLLLTIREWPKITTKMMDFLIINLLLTYNMIIGRPTQAAFGAIPSARHQKMKFCTEQRINNVHNQQMATGSYTTTIRNKATPITLWPRPKNCLDGLALIKRKDSEASDGEDKVSYLRSLPKQ